MAGPQWGSDFKPPPPPLLLHYLLTSLLNEENIRLWPDFHLHFGLFLSLSLPGHWGRDRVYREEHHEAAGQGCFLFCFILASSRSGYAQWEAACWFAGKNRRNRRKSGPEVTHAFYLCARVTSLQLSAGHCKRIHPERLRATHIKICFAK